MGSLASSAAACLLALAVAGCGSSKEGSTVAGGASKTTSLMTSSATSSAATTRTPRLGGQRRPSRALPSKAEALAFANAVNLRLSDLPGFEAQPRSEEHEGAAEKRLSLQLARCVGRGHAQRDIAARGAKFQRKVRTVAAVQIESSVSVVPSAADALKEAQLFRSGRTSACFAEFVRDEFRLAAKGGARVGKVRSASVAPSGKGSFGWKVAAMIDLKGVSVSLYLGIYGFVEGRAQVMLSTFSMFTPIPADAVRHLYALLQQRAKTHSL